MVINEKDLELIEIKYKQFCDPTMIDNPLKVSKFLFKRVKHLAKAKQPLILMNFNNGKSLWFENAKEGIWNYEGSDGIDKKIWIKHKNIKDMQWGDDIVKFYNCQEDCLLPLPQDPIYYQNEVEDQIDMLLSNEEKFKNRGLARKNTIMAFAEIIKWLFLGLAVVIGVIFVAQWLGVDVVGIFQGVTAEAVPEATEVVADVVINP